MELEFHNLNEEELLKNIDEPNGLALQEISDYALSSDVHTPMSPMRATQTNIGLQLVKTDARAERFGVAKEQYGGVGPKYYKDPRYSNAPRTVWHVRTGLHEEIPPPVTPRNRDRIVQKNKHFWSTPVSEVGYDVYNAWYNHFVDRRTKEVSTSLFPRSIVYELEYIKNENHKVMLQALEKEREAFEEKKMRKRNQVNQKDAANKPTEDSKDPCATSPPFWWDEKTGRSFHSQAEPQTQDLLYTASPDIVPINKVDMVRKMQLLVDDELEYQPGEIARGGKVPAQLNPEGPSTKVQWQPRDPSFLQTYDPGRTPVTTPQDSLSERGPEPLRSVCGEQQLHLQQQLPGKSYENSVHHVDCKQPLGCQCHNELVHRHLGAVVTSTPHRPVVPHEKEEAAETTAGGCMSISGICGCESFKQGQRVKTQKPNVTEHEFPGTGIRYSPYGEKERQDELFKVGIPFWTTAARWMDCNKDPLPPRHTRTSSPWND